ncbi:MAG TPA: HAMP domain-containing sensor histidine kinase [Candidatus Acidoferrales bacterium]|nr:HAMP domain-containing sensor histidine kinase [Candidatus Acidoferrales bacterium]
MRYFPNSLRARLDQTSVEWGFVVLLAGFCVVLSVLQYRWTGEVSRAETEHLRVLINEQAQQFCRAFDSELSESCQTLLPRDEDLNDDNRDEIHVADFQKWKSGNPRLLFSRVAVAVPMPEGARLFEQNQASGKLAPMPWPTEWDSFREFLSPQTRNGPRPFERSDGTTFMLPAVVGQPWRDRPTDINLHSGDGGFHDDGGPPSRPGPAHFNEWMIFELDLNYLRKVWLPDLTRRYLNPDQQSLNDVEIKTMAPPGAVIFATAGTVQDFSAPLVKLPLNRQGRDPEDHHGPGGDFCWELEVIPHPGALEAIVATSHHRYLAVAFLLNGLIFAAALALVHHTRRSRTLAEAQMNFVATVSHELRTPLTVIRGAGHNLLRGVAREPGQIEQYSRLIIQHADQLAEMVEQILALAGVKRISSAAVREPVVLADILREAAAATTQDTQAAHCEVRLELPPNLPAISGDAPALRRVFQNLITNAAKHGGSGGWIGITAGSEPKGAPPMVEVRVADRGPGIPASELPDIFKPFFRGAAARTMQIRGSGLGLSLVKEIVEAHGGIVAVESHPGHGAAFVVRLPAANQ